MTALAKLRPVHASSVSMCLEAPAGHEFISDSALTGPQVLAVQFD